MRFLGVRAPSALAFLLLAFAVTPAQARQAGDTARVHSLDALLITAERTLTAVALSTGAVSVITARDLRVRPVRTLAEAVQQTPGVAFIDFDGLGRDPQIMVRGFYGGGEAEYVLLLLDGRPLNDLETGRVFWDLVPLSAIRSIEVVRGGSSSVWGDAAMGAVINVITADDVDAMRGSVIRGERGVTRASASVLDSWGAHRVNFFGDYSRSDGFRLHSERKTGSFGASIGLVETAETSISIFTVNDWRNFDEPGPLNTTQLFQARSQSAIFNRFDHADERRHRIGVDGTKDLGAGSRWNGSLTGEYRNSDRNRTIQLAPDFADTQNRYLTTTRMIGTLQLERHEPFVAGKDHLVMGVDASVGRMASEHSLVMQGSHLSYELPARGDDPVDKGSARRTTAAAYFHYSVHTVPALRLSVGGRVDYLHDTFEAKAPSRPSDESATHLALSPKAGVNYRYADTEHHRGHVYVNVGRSFKAPTPDQLFDQRKVPVPFPPFVISFANQDLEPQKATSIDAGFYHHLGVGRLAADLTLAGYLTELHDELDFDIATLTYQNIGRSRHRGVEAGLTLSGPLATSVFANYTLQSATTEVGEEAGNYLKAIPRHFVVAGFRAGDSEGPAASISVTRASHMYLDDANTRFIPSWSRWDARVSMGLFGLQLFADVYNLRDSQYSTTAFPDPAGSPLVFYFPAAGRTLQFGINWEH